MPNKSTQAPLKLIDIQAMLSQGIRGATPNSLAFMLPNQIPNAQATMAAQGLDPRHLPFSNVSPQLRDQRQEQLVNGNPLTPFSLAGAAHGIRTQTNTLK